MFMLQRHTAMFIYKGGIAMRMLQRDMAMFMLQGHTLAMFMFCVTKVMCGSVYVYKEI